MPKRCGHMRGKELISIGEMTKKIEAGLKAKKDQDFIINARTDAIAVEDIAGTVKRVKAYSKAGADMIYVDAVRGEDDIARAVEAAGDTPVNINMGFGIRQRPTSPLIALKRLRELGVARVSAPRMLTAAAISGMRKALEVMQQCMVTGELADRPDLTASMEEITALFDYDKIAALENEFSLEEDLERKYRDKERSFVVQTGSKQ
jgi:2-methylisocitrate lyase-like PEP mutase family enzyme